MWQDSRLKWYINCLTHLYHCMPSLESNFLLSFKNDLFVLPLLLSRKPPSGTRRFGNHLSLWLVILIQLKELWDPLITLQLIAPKLQRACGGPWRRRISMYADTFVYLRQKDRGQRCRLLTQLLLYKINLTTCCFLHGEKRPPPPVLFFFLLVKDACMSVLWARASLLFAYNPVWKPMCPAQTGKRSGVSYTGNSHQRDNSFGMHVSFSASFPVCISLHFRPFIPLCCEHFVIPSPARSLLKYTSQILSSHRFLTELVVHLVLLKWAFYLKVVGQIGKKIYIFNDLITSRHQWG